MARDVVRSVASSGPPERVTSVLAHARHAHLDPRSCTVKGAARASQWPRDEAAHRSWRFMSIYKRGVDRGICATLQHNLHDLICPTDPSLPHRRWGDAMTCDAPGVVATVLLALRLSSMTTRRSWLRVSGRSRHLRDPAPRARAMCIASRGTSPAPSTLMGW